MGLCQCGHPLDEHREGLRKPWEDKPPTICPNPDCRCWRARPIQLPDRTDSDWWARAEQDVCGDPDFSGLCCMLIKGHVEKSHNNNHGRSWVSLTLEDEIQQFMDENGG